MKIVYSKSSLKFLKGLDKKSAEKIRQAIEGLTHIPPKGDIKPMQGYENGTKRLRIGSWRVIYKTDSDDNIKILYIISIGNRGDIYKK